MAALDDLEGEGLRRHWKKRRDEIRDRELGF
jgi:hypothetical protein